MLKIKLWRKLAWGVALLILSGGAVTNVRAQTVGDYRVYLPLVMREYVYMSPFAIEVVTLTNQHRATVSCPALKINSKLYIAAYNHSRDMALNDFFSHTSPTYGGVSQRLKAVGYSWSGWAENIAAGQTTPTQVVNGWLNSPGHRANIENCTLTEVGVGYFYLQTDTGKVNYHHYWTQTFGRP